MTCGVLQCVAVCCSVLQRVAECCSVLQRVAGGAEHTVGRALYIQWKWSKVSTVVIRHLESLTAANWVSFDFNVSYSSCWGYSLINTFKQKLKKVILHSKLSNNLTFENSQSVFGMMKGACLELHYHFSFNLTHSHCRAPTAARHMHIHATHSHCVDALCEVDFIWCVLRVVCCSWRVWHVLCVAVRVVCLVYCGACGMCCVLRCEWYVLCVACGVYLSSHTALMTCVVLQCAVVCCSRCLAHCRVRARH